MNYRSFPLILVTAQKFYAQELAMGKGGKGEHGME